MARFFAPKFGVSVFCDDNGEHVIIDSGFTFQLAFYDKDPMRFYDESIISDEDKEILDEFKAIVARNDGVNENITKLRKLSELLNNANFGDF